jgi:hypothetical protein
VAIVLDWLSIPAIFYNLCNPKHKISLKSQQNKKNKMTQIGTNIARE